MADRCRIEDITQRNVEMIAKLESSSIERRTMGERLADRAAAWIGSWWFLIIQSVLLTIWMVINVMAKEWDPYPFVLLNLVLPFEAAFATPVILMSENRQARLSERRNQLDLQINLLAEQENTEQLRLLRLLCENMGIDMQQSPQGKAFEVPTAADAIVEQIVKADEEPESDKTRQE